MKQDLGRIGGWAGRHAGRWVGGVVACLLLAIAGPAVSQQAAPAATTAAAPRTYADCMRGYVGRVEPATDCRRLFPATAPAATTPTTQTPYERCLAASGRTVEAQTLCAQRNPGSAPIPTRPPVDITPQVNQLIDSLTNRPRPPAKPPADPLAVVPEIQAACAQWAGNAPRWLRCTAEAWRRTGLRGQPPLVLQTPPAPPPVVDKPPVVHVPTDQTPVKPPPARPPSVQPDPPILTQPDPPADVVPPPAEPKPQPSPPKPELKPTELVEPPTPPRPVPPATPVWAWALAMLVALLAAAAGGFGLSRWLAKRRPPAPNAPKPAVAAASAPPRIALVADPGVITLTTDGPPRAGLAVSMRVALADDVDPVRLDYPTLETAP